MNGVPDNFGYCRVKLYKNRKYQIIRIHRLVAETFIPNTNKNANCVNHKDCNPKNNNVDNLEWVIYKENNFYPKTYLKRELTNIKKFINTNFKESIELKKAIQNLIDVYDQTT